MHRTVLALATAGALAVPAAASAAPAATLTLADGGTNAFAFSGGPGNGVLPDALDLVGVGPVSADSVKCGDPTADCVDTLVKTDDEGDLTFDLHGDAGSSPTDTTADPEDPVFGDKVRYDLDAFIYSSDESGTQGDEVASSTSPYADETAVASDVPAGYYLLRVVYYQSVQGTFKASAKLSQFVPPPPDDEGE